MDRARRQTLIARGRRSLASIGIKSMEREDSQLALVPGEGPRDVVEAGD